MWRSNFLSINEGRKQQHYGTQENVKALSLYLVYCLASNHGPEIVDNSETLLFCQNP